MYKHVTACSFVFRLSSFIFRLSSSHLLSFALMPYDNGYNYRPQGFNNNQSTYSHSQSNPSIISGSPQNQHVKFGENEHLPREPRAMKRERSQNPQNNGNIASDYRPDAAISSKRVKIDGDQRRRQGSMQESWATGKWQNSMRRQGL